MASAVRSVVVPVADASPNSPGAEFARLAAADGLARLGIDDLDLDVGMNRADRRDAALDRDRRRRGLGRNRGRSPSSRRQS